MKLSTRYGLVGIGALSLLAVIHWQRGAAAQLPPVAEYLAGVGPNFAAAIAIAFVLLSIWADQNPDAAIAAARRAFLACASISGLGLLGWELVQTTSSRFVFDPHDVGATFVGLGVACLLFYLLARPKKGRS